MDYIYIAESPVVLPFSLSLCKLFPISDSVIVRILEIAKLPDVPNLKPI